MSLINDALKNAHRKAAQPRQSPVDGLALRPPEPGQHARRNAWLVPAIVGLVLALVAIAAFNFYLGRDSATSGLPPETLTVNAREITPTPPSTTATPQKAAAPATPKAIERPTRAAVAVNPAPAAPPVSPASEPLPASSAATTQPAPGSGARPAVTAAPLPPQPEPLRLQAIIFHPTRPSALISGKTVFVGERVQGMTVVSITKGTATLTANGKNTELRLSE